MLKIREVESYVGKDGQFVESLALAQDFGRSVVALGYAAKVPEKLDIVLDFSGSYGSLNYNITMPARYNPRATFSP